MNSIEKEYAFFKKICQSRLIPKSQENLLLSEQLKAKGLKIVEGNDSLTLTNDTHELSKTAILSTLNSKTRQFIDSLNVIYETASTNKAINAEKPGSQYSILLSECQTAGQGRREKKWSSPLGENIYLSIRFVLANNQFSNFIPLVTALSVCQALSNIGIKDCQIKWPNDIYLGDKKLGGILVENRFNAQKHQDIVVGIGLNVNMQVNNEIDKQWTSLHNCQKNFFDRNIIVSALLTETLGNYNQLSFFDFSKFHQDWSAKDYLKGRQISVMEEVRNYNATALGLADDGALIIEYEQDERKFQKKIYSAEVSIIPLASFNCDK